MSIADLLNQIRPQFKRSLKSKTVRQTGILYTSQLLVMVLGVATVPILTRALGPKQFGVLSFTLALIGFVALFFEFGFFSAGARLLALAREGRTERGLIGALTVITAGIAIGFFITIFILSFFVDRIFETQIGGILRLISILVAFYPFQYMLQQVCQGTRSIERMALQNVVPKLWYLGGLLILISLFRPDATAVLVLNITGVIVATGIIVCSLRPSFSDLANHVTVIWKETKEYGFYVYIGRVAGMATYNSDRMLISYFVDTTSVGFYSLAMTLTHPMFLLSRSLSTTLFKTFAQRERIPRKVIYVNLLWLTVTCLGLVVLRKYIVMILLGGRFIKVIPILVILAFANLFRGMTQPYNGFLGAKGQGKPLRNTAVILTVCNLLGNFTLIPLLGAIGAAYASLFALIMNYFAHVYYYRRHMR